MEGTAVIGTVVYKLLKYLDKQVLVCAPGFPCEVTNIQY